MAEKRTRKPRAVVWDLDGTLSDDRARAHFVEVEAGRSRDWRSYFDAIDQDPPIAASMEVLRALHAQGLRIVFLTGRPEYTREKTERWLKANGLTEYDRLLMRPRGDFRPSGLFKVEVIARLWRDYELVCAFEDRIDVAGHLREAGVPVFLYGAGAEAAAEALEVLDASQDELVERREERETADGRGTAERPRTSAPAGTRKRTSRDSDSSKKTTGTRKRTAKAADRPEKPGGKTKKPGAKTKAARGTKRAGGKGKGGRKEP
jgi:beta-phosphoglucomutase-like phosphatase (HAD superfamily)